MKQIVGVADMKISNNLGDSILTYSLGSCIGLVIYDPVAKIGGLLHYILPESKIDKTKARNNPFMFADTGIPKLFETAYQFDAKKNRMEISVFGGAQILGQQGFFNIGQQNYMALKKIFLENQLIINKENIGGEISRTIRLEIKTGDIFIKTSGTKEVKV
ncbi:MAG: chemotaxis protein CheD [Desulfobacteraceae bacterium]|nr:chemotaxis protein CheD [Desulfobacteraceae bacterium]